MERISKIVNSSLFKVALCGVAGSLLLIESLPLYSGIALGIGVREFLLAFKK